MLKEKIYSFLLNLITFGFYGILSYCHKSMTRQYTSTQKKITFEEFKVLFDSVNWDNITNRWPNSVFMNDDEVITDQFHAGIIKINNIGYLMTSWGFIQAQKYVIKFVSKKLSEESINN